MKKYINLNAMLDSDPVVREYFDKLPGHVRDHIRNYPNHINSFDRLLRYTEHDDSGIY